MTLIKSHSYTINLANVNYIRSHIDSPSMTNMTMFKMNNGKTVQITCPYDVVIHQLAGSMTHESYAVKVVNLEY